MRFGKLLAVASFVFASATHSALAQSSSDTRSTAVATTAIVTQTSTQNVTRTISNAISGSLGRIFQSGGVFRQDFGPKRVSLMDTSTGVSTGEGPIDIGAWGSFDYTNLRVVPDGDRKQRRLTDIYSAIGGIDFVVADRTLLGIAVSYARAETDGRKTSGARLDQSANSYTISPYIGYAPTDNLSLDGLLGYTHTTMDTKDYGTTVVAKGSNSSNTVFAAANIGYQIGLTDVFAVKAFSGISGQYGKVESYRDSQNVDVAGSVTPHWQARVGAKLMAAVTESTQGYFSAAYERERDIRAISESSVRLSLGGATALSKGVDLTIESTANIGRETQQEYGVATNLRFSF